MEVVQPPIVGYLVNIDAICIQFRTDSPLSPHPAQHLNQGHSVPSLRPSQTLEKRCPYADHNMAEAVKPHPKQYRGVDDHRTIEALQDSFHLLHHGRMND